MWERWDAYVKGRGPQSSMMNSFNHFAIGSVGEWIYRVILGINLDENNPGYKHFIINPKPHRRLNWVKGSYESINGKIVVNWSFNDLKYILEVSIPPNTTAEVRLPYELTQDSMKSISKNPNITIKKL